MQGERRESRWQRYALTGTVACILDQVFKKENLGSDLQTNDFSREKLFKKFFFIEAYLIFNAVLVSGIEQLCLIFSYTHLFFSDSFPLQGCYKIFPVLYSRPLLAMFIPLV